MVFVDPDTFVLTTREPTDSTDLVFKFNYQFDTGNFFAIFPFSVIFTLHYRPTKSSNDITGWTSIGTKVVELVPGMNSNPITMTADKKIPAGKYDFMVIEQGDLAGAGRSDLTRYGYITEEILKECSDRAMWCTDGCINEPYVTCIDCPLKSGCGTSCESNYCGSGCGNELEEICKNKECDITCQLTKAIDPIKQYVPYIVGGAVLLVLALVIFKKRKTVSTGVSSGVSKLIAALKEGE